MCRLLQSNHYPNSFGNAGLIFKPYHLCGVETAISLLSAVLLNQPTSGKNLEPVYDVVAEARVDLNEGNIAGGDKGPDLKALMLPAIGSQDEDLIPLHLARGNPLKRSIEKGKTLRYQDIVPPEASKLWELRTKQDALYSNPHSRNP